MKFCGIICEFNPLHNGHRYLIEQAKKITSLPILCIMSGNFCQRGEMTILNKQTRAKHAILAGADAVIELPPPFAFNNAEMFAYGAIKTLKALNCVEYLCFGSECGDVHKLQSIANFLIDEKPAIDKQMQELLKTGKSYPACLQKAYEKLTKQPSTTFSSANDILAIEYLKQLRTQNCEIQPLAIKRQGEAHKSQEIANYSSSTAIREAIFCGNKEKIKNSVPDFVYEDLKSAQPNTFFEQYELFALRTATIESMQKLYDVSTDGLQHRLKKYENAQNISEVIEKAKAKAHTHSRLRRVVLNNALGITQEQFEECKRATPIANILAVKSKDMLSAFKCSSATTIYSARDLKKLDAEQKDWYSIFSLCDTFAGIKKDTN